MLTQTSTTEVDERLLPNDTASMHFRFADVRLKELTEQILLQDGDL